MLIRLDDLAGPEIRSLLEEHLCSMHELSPPESVHALDLSALRRPEITFWTAWSHSELLGCGALKELAPSHGEVKSMRTAMAHRGKGVGKMGPCSTHSQKSPVTAFWPSLLPFHFHLSFRSPR